jgi:hypothetical protein
VLAQVTSTKEWKEFSNEDVVVLKTKAIADFGKIDTIVVAGPADSHQVETTLGKANQWGTIQVVEIFQTPSQRRP